MFLTIKKKSLLIFLCVVICLISCGVYFGFKNTFASTYSGLVVVIDAGHGGADGGSVSYKALTYEVIKIHQPSETTTYTNPNYDLGEYVDGLEIKVLTQDASTAKAALLALGYTENQLNALETACEQMNVDFTQLVAVLAAAKQGGQQFEGQLGKLVSSSNTMGQTLSKIGSAASQVAMGLTAGIGDIWRNQDISVGEKLTSTMMNLATVLPLVGTAIDAVRKIKLLMTAQSQAARGAIEAETLAQMKQMGITSLETAGLWGKAAAWIAAASSILACTPAGRLADP